VGELWEIIADKFSAAGWT